MGVSVIAIVLGLISVLLSVKLSFLCLASGIDLATRGSSTDCITFLQWSLIAIGLVLIATFITAAYCMRRHKEITLLLVMLCHLALLSLMIAAFVHININAVEDGPGKSNKDDMKKPQPVREYSLGDYGGQLRRRVADPSYWAQISGCLRHRRSTCGGMSPLIRDPSTGVFLAERMSETFPHDTGLSPIESGCCKPPLSCGFTYVNQTTWTAVPENNTSDDDCSRWSSDQENLCFQCDSCKAGVLADIQRAWNSTVILITFITIFNIILYPFTVQVLCSD